MSADCPLKGDHPRIGMLVMVAPLARFGQQVSTAGVTPAAAATTTPVDPVRGEGLAACNRVGMLGQGTVLRGDGCSMLLLTMPHPAERFL